MSGNMLLWVVLLVACLTAVSGQERHARAIICDVCNCQSAEPVQSVTCVCNNATKHLYTTQENMRGLNHIKTFSVSKCDSVTFNKDSFVDSHDLTVVTVSHVGVVKFPLGVFASLTQLKVEDVGDLRLEEKAFMGVNTINEVSIRRTTIAELKKYALYETHGIRRFEMTDVTIGVVRSKAIDIDMSPQSNFVIDRCTVNDIESEAIVLKTDRFLIKDSSFHGISRAAVNVSAVDGVTISGSVFGNAFYPNVVGIVVNSNTVAVVNNTFDVLPIGILNSYQRTQAKVTFTNNLVYNFTLDPKKIDLSLITFDNNRLSCNCALAKSVLAYKALVTSNTDKLTGNNYCTTNCVLSLTTLSEKIHDVCHNGGVNNLDFLCEKVDQATAQDQVGLGPRMGKGIDEDEASTEGESWTLESEHQHADSDQAAFSAAGRSDLNVAIITYFLLVITARAVSNKTL